MLQRGQREVYGQYGERIDQQLITALHHPMHLLCRTVLRTEETRTLGYRLRIDLGSCRTDAGRIPLGLEHQRVDHQLTCLHPIQVAIALTHIVPRL